MLTVRSSTTSTDWMGFSTNGNRSGVRAGYRPRKASRLFLTTWAVSGVPSWNVTPSRTVMVHWVKSSLCSSDSARYGTNSPSALGVVSVS